MASDRLWPGTVMSIGAYSPGSGLSHHLSQAGLYDSSTDLKFIYWKGFLEILEREKKKKKERKKTTQPRHSTDALTLPALL